MERRYYIHLLHPVEMSSRSSNKALWRLITATCWCLSTEMSLGVLFKTYLRRRWDVQRDVLLPGEYCLKILSKIKSAKSLYRFKDLMERGSKTLCKCNLKSDFLTFQKNCFIYFNESPSQMITFKVFFVLKIFQFLS